MKKYTRTYLVEERKHRHWSQQQVADLIGTTQNNVSRWELGITTPSQYFRAKLCELFGKNMQELGLVEEDPLLLAPIEEEALGTARTSSSPTGVLALWTVPYRRNPYFTGRDELLHLLDQHLSGAIRGEQTATRCTVLTQTQAIKGLGGIGKTQIAVEYAYRAREQGQYTHTFWINAASKEAMMTSFTALAEVLPGFSAKNETDQQKLVVAVKCWLEQCPERWCLIFDNADTLSWVQEYFPQQGNGSILITTRANAVGSLAASIEVEKMGFVEGTHLLLRRAQRFVQASDEEVNEAGNIVVALDHFPLALEQAGAYIEETGCSLGNYLQLYQTHRKALLARRGAQSTNYPDSVATTWSLSFQKVEQANPAAAELLCLCAFLAPDHIPEELLTQGASHWPPMLQQAVANLFTFDQMLEELLAFSLVKRLVENRMLSLHRLVQVVQIETMDPEEQRRWAERVVLAVNTLFPRDPKEDVASWPYCLRYLEQVQACDMLIQKHRLVLSEAADLLDRSVTYLCEHALYTLAEPLCQRALHIREQSLGPKHPDTATSLRNLGLLYGSQGKPKLTEPLFLRALSIHEQHFGSHHLETASSLHALAIMYLEQGKFAEAESPCQRALHIREQNLGPDHLQVASVLYFLAIVYARQEKYAEAEPLYQRALHIWEQRLGPDHPQVAPPLHALAILYQEQEKYGEAESLCQRALDIWEQRLGPDHPRVSYSLLTLAELYQGQGKYVEAESLYQRTLHIREQRLGPEHPDVAYPLTGLASLYREQGKYIEAEPLFQRALHIREHALEPDHPDIADTLHGFAVLREAQGDREEAASLYGRALAIREKVYGRQHPKTTDTRERLRALQWTKLMTRPLTL